MAQTTTARILFFCLFILAAVLRIAHLNQYDLWYDELTTMKCSYQLISAHAEAQHTSQSHVFFHKLRADPNGPFYYCLVYVYSYFFGNGKALRFLSVILSLLGLWAFYRLCRLFLDRTPTLFAVGLVVLSPFQLWYAQEARGYSLDFFLACAAGFGFIKALRTGKASYWALFYCFGLCALFSNYFSFLLLLGMGLIFLGKEYRTAFPRYALMMALFILPLALHMLFVGDKLNKIVHHFWLASVTLPTILQSAGVFLLGYSAERMLLSAAIVTAIIFTAWGIYAYSRKNPTDALFLASCALLPIALTYLVSLFFLPIYLTRKMIICSPFFYILFITGICSLRWKRASAIALSALAGLLIGSLMRYYANYCVELADGNDFYPGIHAKPRYAALMKHVGASYQKGDLLVSSDFQSFFITYFYFNTPDESKMPIHFFFYPHLVSDSQWFTITTMASKDQLNDALLSRSDNSTLHTIVYPNAAFKATLRPIDENEIKKYRRIWLFVATWNKHGPLEANLMETRAYLSRFFEREITWKEKTFSVEIYKNIAAE